MPTRLIRILRFSPVVAALLLVAIWLFVPGALRGQMLSLAAGDGQVASSAVDADGRFSFAEDYLREAARRKASAAWPDTQFARAAQGSALLVPDVVDEECREGRARAYMMSADAEAFLTLNRFAKDYPGTEVFAYLVPQPDMPSVVATFTAQAPEDIRPNRFEFAWTRALGTRSTMPFLPRQWRGPDVVIPTANPAEWSMLTRTSDGRLFRASVYGAQTADPAGLALMGDPHAEFDSHPDLFGEESNLCAGCHMEHTAFGDDLNDPDSMAGGFTMLVGGPVRLEALAQYSTETSAVAEALGQRYLDISLASTDTAYVRLPSKVDGEPDRWGTAIWVTPSKASRGQTMLYVCTLPDDPHGAFEDSLDAAPMRQLISARSWAAANLEWLLVAAGSFLGVSLVGASAAHVVELRRVSRERARNELARVQRDAHDRVYNRLAALSQRVEETAVGLPTASSEQLGSVAEDIRATVLDLQTILGGSVAEGAGGARTSLAMQLQAVTAAQGSRHGMAVSFAEEGAAAEVPARLGWDLQCVLEEAITNAVKHGHAAHVGVAVRFDSGELAMTVADDGRGLAEHAEPTRASTGLAGMRDRLSEWGGTVEVLSDDAGATLVARIPLPVRRQAGEGERRR